MPTAVPRKQDQPASESETNIWIAAADGDLERVKYLVDEEGQYNQAEAQKALKE